MGVRSCEGFEDDGHLLGSSTDCETGQLGATIEERDERG